MEQFQGLYGVAKLALDVDYLLWNNGFKELQEGLQGTTREQREEVFRQPSLALVLHWAVERKSLELVTYLVECGARLDEKDSKGMTPLNHAFFQEWDEGAEYLVRKGADVVKADEAVKDLDCCHYPLLHSAVMRENLELVKELFERGADINAKTCAGTNCLEWRSENDEVNWFVWQKLKEAASRRGELPQGPYGSEISDFEAVLDILRNVDEARKIIDTKGPCEKARLLQLLGASFLENDMSEEAGSCLKEAALSACKCHNFEISANSLLRKKNSFAEFFEEEYVQEILDKDPELIFNNEADLRALFIFEELSPNLEEVNNIVRRLANIHYKSGQEDLAIDFLCHLPRIKQLTPGDCGPLIGTLTNMMKNNPDPSRISRDSALHIMNTLVSCVNVTMNRAFEMNGSPETKHNMDNGWNSGCLLCSNLAFAYLGFMDALHIFCRHETPATAEEERRFKICLEHFLESFPCFRGGSLFHWVGEAKNCDPQAMGELVLRSSELWGQKRQNSPPHLLAGKDGNTPLHMVAQHLSRDELLESGLLELFLEHGAHLCTKNKEGRSIRSILLERGVLKEEEYLPPLQCRAAAAFMGNAGLRARVHEVPNEAVRHFLLDH